MKTQADHVKTQADHVKTQAAHVLALGVRLVHLHQQGANLYLMTWLARLPLISSKTSSNVLSKRYYFTT